MGRFVPVRSSQKRASGRKLVHVSYGLLGHLMQVGANLGGVGALSDFSSKQKGPGEEGAAGYCPKILLPKRATMVLCSFLWSHTGKFALENRPLSETKFLDDFWGPFLSRPLWFTADD